MIYWYYNYISMPSLYKNMNSYKDIGMRYLYLFLLSIDNYLKYYNWIANIDIKEKYGYTKHIKK